LVSDQGLWSRGPNRSLTATLRLGG
jgi:hypothetical protein